MSGDKNPLRLQKKHGTGQQHEITVADGQRIVDAQSPRNAIVAALIVILVFCLLWAPFTALIDRVLPWMTVFLGAGIGLAVRGAGRGVDWRFPVLAALLAVVGSAFAYVFIAAANTAEAFGVGTLHVLNSVTAMTWPVYFDEVLNVAYAFYAFCAAALAAFFANRRLSRQEYHGLRLWRIDKQNG